ncbi:MAG: peroxide stress protein YaaA, partial [Flavobacteriales bacterium]
MSKLIAVISPAKLLDESLHFPKLQNTLPDFLPQAKSLMDVLKKKTPKQIGEMMELSEKLSLENFERNQVWNDQFSVENATQAILLFKGDVYRG